jgi:hypothetical protein
VVAWARAIAVLSSVIALSACTADPKEHPCANVTLDCRPTYDPPTFAVLYKGIFKPTCASVPGTCHTSQRISGGLDMSTEDKAFEGLSKRVQPENLGCSLLTRKIESDDPDWRMPLGDTPLSEPNRCAIRKWIANGAQR